LIHFENVGLRYGMGPEILRDRIVPRFVDSFNEARG
jgi:hypothetical protein